MMEKRRQRFLTHFSAMKSGIAIVISLTVSALCPHAGAVVPASAETVTGQVLLDGAPLVGVRVSDGVGFATTGADGRYSLTLAPDATIPYRPARVLSISWPSGTWPEGPWWRRLEGVAPGGSVDFALRRQGQTTPFVFLHVSDDHSNGTMYPLWGVDVGTITPAAKFVVNTGDMGYATAANGEDMFTSIAANARTLPIPMFFVPGNHDILPGTPGDPPRHTPLAGLGAYTKYLGPPRWSFDYAGAHFVGVDVSSTGAAWRQRDLAAISPGQRVFGFVHRRNGLKGDPRITHTFSGHTHNPLQIPGASVPLPLAGMPRGKALNLLVDKPDWLSNGTCVMGIVGESSFRVADRCAGCKAGQPMFHLRSLCPLGRLDSQFIPSLKGRRRAPATLGDPVMQAGHSALLGNPGGSASVEIETEVGTPAGGTAWLRIGQVACVEVGYDGARLTVAGLPIPLTPRAGENTVKLHMRVTRTALTLYANSLITVTWPVTVDDPSQVTAGATDGPVFFKSLTVWELH